MRKITQILIYYFLPITLVCLFIFYDNARLFRTFGSWSFWVVTLVLFLKPLSTLLSFHLFKILMTYRRELGILSFWLFFGHAVGLLVTGSYRLEFVLIPFSLIFWGFLAGIGMTVLALTSNTFSVKLLKRNWKKLQQSVYVIYYLLLYHASLSENKPENIVIFGGGYAILKLLEIIKLKRSR